MMHTFVRLVYVDLQKWLLFYLRRAGGAFAAGAVNE
jgi:hypothetical protein